MTNWLTLPMQLNLVLRDQMVYLFIFTFIQKFKLEKKVVVMKF